MTTVNYLSRDCNRNINSVNSGSQWILIARNSWEAGKSSGGLSSLVAVLAEAWNKLFP